MYRAYTCQNWERRFLSSSNLTLFFIRGKIKKQSMRNSLFSWESWLIIVVVILSTISASLPTYALPLPLQHSSSSFHASDLGVSDRLFTKPVSPAQEFSLRGEQQSKRCFLLARVRYLTSYHPPHQDRFWQRFALDDFSFQFFFPRKISPPSSLNDPFLD